MKTQKPYSVTIPGHELWDLNQGEPIMCLKSLDAGDREFAMTGISPEGWKQLFSA
jgi:hypothetical protein|tara:strand:- start:39 stop:203 length:165 start_codon:yes stop_codon:yes gene_type:complete